MFFTSLSLGADRLSGLNTVAEGVLWLPPYGYAIYRNPRGTIFREVFKLKP